jgi:hypothetical protein
MEAKSATSLASACGEAEGFTQRIALLEGELTEMRLARDIAKVNSWGLSNVAADANWRW